jgi:uncharacterized membrane protein YvlD (DUF360 family)
MTTPGEETIPVGAIAAFDQLDCAGYGGLGFRVDKFLAALLGALIVSIVSFILSRALTRNLKTQA